MTKRKHHIGPVPVTIARGLNSLAPKRKRRALEKLPADDIMSITNPVLFVPREMTAEEQARYKAQLEQEHARAVASVYKQVPGPGESPRIKSENMTDKAVHDLADMTTEAPIWAHSQVLAKDPFRKVVVQGHAKGGVHIVFINTFGSKQVQSHIRLNMDSAQALHDLLELAGCTPVKTPMAVEMTFEVPEMPAQKKDA